MQLRDEVLRQPLGLEFTVSQISAESCDFHFGCYEVESGLLLGTLLMTARSTDVLKMRQVAVQPFGQGQGVGRHMVEAVEVWARCKGYSQLELAARDVAVSFYLKLNYKKQGKKFEEVGIPHYKMVKVL